MTVSGTGVAWLESLSPWPTDGFGTERMRALLDRLGNPQRTFDAVHVVGTKGKSTATRRIARTIGGPAYTSPHVAGWHERLDTDPAGFEQAIARVRAAAEAVNATQFETVTAAAFADFAARGATVAAIEAGLGGRHDATNVIDARVVLLTNVGLEHTEVLGDTREQIAAEKLAVAGPGAVVVLPDDEFAHLVEGEVRIGGAQEAVTAFLGEARRRWPRRACRAGSRSGTARSATARTRRRPPTGCWKGFPSRSTTSSSPRSSVTRTPPRSSIAWPAPGRRSSRRPPRTPARCPPRRWPSWVGVVSTWWRSSPSRVAALTRAHELGPRVLVTGSLYLLADLAETSSPTYHESRP